VDGHVAQKRDTDLLKDGMSTLDSIWSQRDYMYPY
jgi:hypothetical protein